MSCDFHCVAERLADVLQFQGALLCGALALGWAWSGVVRQRELNRQQRARLRSRQSHAAPAATLSCLEAGLLPAQPPAQPKPASHGVAQVIFILPETCLDVNMKQVLFIEPSRCGSSAAVAGSINHTARQGLPSTQLPDMALAAGDAIRYVPVASSAKPMIRH